jgi:hypothetical protein
MTSIKTDEETAALFLGTLHRKAVKELQEIEDREIFNFLEQAFREFQDEKDLKDWSRRLKKGALLAWLPVILAVSAELALALIWALS